MSKQEKMHELRVLAEEIRLETLKIIASRGFGHVGGSMSLCEAMAVCYGAYMNIDPKNPDKEDRDWFVLSKGHAGPVEYATLGVMGYYPVSDAYKLNQSGTVFPSHTDRTLTTGVDITTGSLGQGIGEAAGVAKALKIKGLPGRVFCVVGDGECDEGAVWEAAQFSAHYKLDNFIVLVDDNKRQLDGAVCDIMSHGKGINKKFDAFGWDVIEVADGNDIEQVYDAVGKACEKAGGGKPICVFLNTKKGKGATFAEASGEHSSQPSQEKWDEAIKAAQERYEAVKAEK